ncbi:hypothetical protein [Henriciella aquimarina]|uniref:hypothetical protein n=1 Tax=Henriciella aquimarina TaxID=545261 RepID=UPI000A0682DC|nr:hypothetical protein [Henriciella aquimarina]
MPRSTQPSRFAWFTRIWSEAGPTSRMIAGTLIVVTIGLIGLTPKTLFNTELVWPYAALVAAIGWGRSGLAFRPMAVLVLFGFAQDVSAYAPLGCFGFINLSAFGLSALVHRSFDRERSPVITSIAPIFIYAAAFSLVWLFASFNSNHLVQAEPLIKAYAVTYILHIIAAPAFDLGRRVGPLTGSMA